MRGRNGEGCKYSTMQVHALQYYGTVYCVLKVQKRKMLVGMGWCWEQQVFCTEGRTHSWRVKVDQEMRRKRKKGGGC